MAVRNEADRYLRRVLAAASRYVTSAVIVDDASTDATVEVCAQELSRIPYRIVHNARSRFHHEVDLRRQQWQEATATGADWVLVLDADEIFEDRFQHEVPSLLADPEVDAYYFRLYDFWNEHQFRDDDCWRAHTVYRPFLVRSKPAGTWKETALHCGRFPLEVSSFPYRCSDLRLKHLGWATPEDRRAKLERYRRLDPEGAFGWKAQYDSILDPSPHLVDWLE